MSEAASRRVLTADEREELRGFAPTLTAVLVWTAGLMFATRGSLELVWGNQTLASGELIVGVILVGFGLLLFRGNRLLVSRIYEALEAGEVYVVQHRVTSRSGSVVEEKIEGIGMQWSYDGKPSGWRVHLKQVRTRG